MDGILSMATENTNRHPNYDCHSSPVHRMLVAGSQGPCTLRTWKVAAIDHREPTISQTVILTRSRKCQGHIIDWYQHTTSAKAFTVRADVAKQQDSLEELHVTLKSTSNRKQSSVLALPKKGQRNEGHFILGGRGSSSSWIASSSCCCRLLTTDRVSVSIQTLSLLFRPSSSHQQSEPLALTSGPFWWVVS